ncbi:MAG: YdeI/OmpD-associated family protein [Chloroflexia bacterium]
MIRTFYTIIQQEGNNTGIVVPDEIVTYFNSGRNPKVKVTINDYTWRGTVQVVGGKFMISFSADKREATGVMGGDTIFITIELDTEPRTVELPDDLKAALAEKPGATEAFDTIAFSRRKEYVRQVEEAKTPETRTRRIAKVVAEIGESK